MSRPAELAERAGFESFWTGEHHFLDEFSHCSAPGVLYGAIAARTERIRIGHGVRLLPYPYNHPVRAAESAAVVDLLSEGRLEFGTGRSTTRAELEGFGIRPDETRSMWEEALRIVVGAWTEDVFHFDGKHFQIPPRARRSEAAPAAASAALGRDAQPGRARARRPPGPRAALGHLATAPEDLAGRIARYRRGLAEAEPIGHFINPRAATFTLAHVAETTREAIADAAGLLRVVPAGACEAAPLARALARRASVEPRATTPLRASSTSTRAS